MVYNLITEKWKQKGNNFVHPRVYYLKAQGIIYVYLPHLPLQVFAGSRRLLKMGVGTKTETR